MCAHRSKGQKKERTSKMRDMNRDGLDRHSDNGGTKVAPERTQAIPGRIGLCSNCLAGIRSAL